MAETCEPNSALESVAPNLPEARPQIPSEWEGRRPCLDTQVDDLRWRGILNPTKENRDRERGRSQHFCIPKRTLMICVRMECEGERTDLYATSQRPRRASTAEEVVARGVGGTALAPP